MNTIYDTFVERQPAVESLLGEPVSICGCAGEFCIFQREKGHRHSIDDAATSWYALEKSPTASRILDLGTGIGSVGLAVLWGLGSEATLTCIEAQDVSYRLLQANIECNGLTPRVKALHGDLRELNLSEKFPLITGSPPYFPPHTGVLPPDSQKAHARFELRGDVSDYTRAAARHLEEDGVFVFCFPFQQKARCIHLVHGAGMRIVSLCDVIPHKNKPPLFSLYSARLKWEGGIIEEAPLVVAGENGGYSPAMLMIQRARGFSDLGKNKRRD